MFEWLSDNRASFALVTLIGLVIAFVWGRSESVLNRHAFAPGTRCSAIRSAHAAVGTGRCAVYPR